jgi:hypothetical protein
MADLATLNDGDSAVYIGTLRDEEGDAIPVTGLESLTLTVYDPTTGNIINTRNAQDVLDANNVSCYDTLQTIIIDGKTHTYNIRWLMQPADNVVQGANLTERRNAFFISVWSTGTKRATHPFTWLIQKQPTTPLVVPTP